MTVSTFLFQFHTEKLHLSFLQNLFNLPLLYLKALRHGDYELNFALYQNNRTTPGANCIDFVSDFTFLCNFILVFLNTFARMD